MIPRDKIRIVRSVSGSDGAGGRTKQSEVELMNGLAEVKEIKAPTRLDLLQTKLNQAIQVKFYKRKGLILRADDVLYWNDQTYKLQGADVAEDARNVTRVVIAIR